MDPTLPTTRKCPFVGMLVVGCAILLTGCASLPPREGLRPSVALDTAANTSLGALVQRSLAEGGSGFRMLPEPVAALEARLALIARAERTLDLQYFIWKPDATGRLLLAALERAAGRGVRVRLLLDDLYGADADHLLQKLVERSSVEVRLFNPFPTGRHSFVSRVTGSLSDLGRIRHRMHNKLFVADNAIAITGGRNIGDEYLTQGEGTFLDMDILVAGPLVHDLSDSFDDYWNSDLAYGGPQMWGTTPAAGPEQHQVPGPGLPDASTAGPLAADIDSGRLHLEVCPGARVFADPVEKANGVALEDSSATLHQRLIQLFAQAQQEIHIVSPYFVRGRIGLERIKALADRGVRLRVLTNSLASTDELPAHVAYLRYRHQLLRLGVELREFAPSPHLGRRSDSMSASGLHAKLALVDRRWLYVGSLNFTSRSERLNTEVGLVLDCPVLTRQVMALVEGVPAYRLRLDQKRAGIEWVDRRRGPEEVWAGEPEASLWQRLKSLLLDPFVPEQEI